MSPKKPETKTTLFKKKKRLEKKKEQEANPLTFEAEIFCENLLK